MGGAALAHPDPDGNDATRTIYLNFAEERLTLTADRLQLRYELTVEDPEYLTSPATYTAMWDHRPDLTPGSACDPENSERFREE